MLKLYRIFLLSLGWGICGEGQLKRLRGAPLHSDAAERRQDLQHSDL